MTSSAGGAGLVTIKVASVLWYNAAMISESAAPELVREIVGDTPYDYYPLGEFVVIAPGICGGRPTFKYTRLEVSTILALLREGQSVDEVAAEYEHSNLEPVAVREAIRLANEAFLHHAQAIYPFAV